ncbi:uncharacterized protein LOC111878993 isoform X1 [Lactuca sativa]|uniref:uncharacterized protein LOC111878993 isoform X1 n=1 Tax=Lactuca sativa TaxID=4236 RepID=UPI000CD99AA5|nr:uncharacterized protein LOC111878993 isoform X1 [Lactuca sativa]
MKRKRAYGQRKAKTPLAKKTVQIDATLVAENDEPEVPETSMNFQPVGKSVSDEKTEKNLTSVHMETETPRNGSRQADLEIEKAVYGRMQNHPNELRKMIASIIKDMSKEAGGLANLTKTLAENSISNEQMEQPHADMDLDENNSKLHQNPEYKQQELDTALSVIKKTMKLDAADPFNRPVDPVALEIPDYFDVIDTPMDFGTICNNLENGLKYMNSGDVFKDVEYIWYNCVKYNKKGDHILELMKRVKTFFTKYWIAAGLHCEQSPTFVIEPAVQQNMHNEGHSVSPVTPIADKRSTQVQSIPPSSKENRPGLSSNVQYHVPGFTNANSGVAESSISRHKKQGKDFPLVPLTNNLSNQNASGSNQIVQNQPEPINMQHPVLPQQSSNNLPQSSPEQDEPNIDSRSIQKKRQGRGPTRCVRLLNTVGRIKVLTNELGQPVGSEASQLTSFLGLTARDGNLAPLIYPSWSKVPEENKENMWQKVLMKFDIDPSSRSWVLMSLGTKWRNFKSLLKTTHYDTHSTDEERLADCDDRVLPDQWAVLVSQWSSEKWQRISAKNKANRARHKFSHTSGKKSFARIREEERAKRTDGQEPSRAELFILTRTRKNGQPVNEATAAVISQLRETDGNKNEVKDDVYERVMGVDRKGGVSLYGLNATTPSRPGPEVSTRVEALNMVAEKNAEVLQMKDKLASLEQTCSQMSAQMSQMLSMMSTLHKATPPQNIPNTVDGTLIPVGTPNQSEPTSTSIHEVPVKQTRGRKKRR